MEQRFTYRPQGVCSQQIELTLDNNIIRKVVFYGGCHGNTQGISALIEGMPAAEAIRRLRGIDCHGKGTSCPDQLAQALERMTK